MLPFLSAAPSSVCAPRCESSTQMHCCFTAAAWHFGRLQSRHCCYQAARESSAGRPGFPEAASRTPQSSGASGGVGRSKLPHRAAIGAVRRAVLALQVRLAPVHGESTLIQATMTNVFTLHPGSWGSAQCHPGFGSGL